MDKLAWRIALGGGLIILGLFSLLDTLGILAAGSLIWGLFFALGGAAFLYLLVSDRMRFWWAAIPGFTLLGISALLLSDAIFPRLADFIGGSLVVGFIGLGFLVVYLIQRGFWWALIPAGVMLTTAAFILLDAVIPGDIGWLFLIGLAATFGVVSLVSVEGKRLSWALWPAGILLVIGLLVMVDEMNLAGVIIPIVMILGGAVLVWRAFSRRGPTTPSVL